MGRGGDDQLTTVNATLFGSGAVRGKGKEVEGITLIELGTPPDIGSEAHRQRLADYVHGRTGRFDVSVSLSDRCSCSHRLEEHQDGMSCSVCDCSKHVPSGGSYTDMRGNITVQSDIPPRGDLSDRELVINGLLRHEVCHELYTDRNAFDLFIEEVRKMERNEQEVSARNLKHIWNILEDGRIETIERNYKPGSYRFISAMNKIWSRIGEEEDEVKEEFKIMLEPGIDYVPEDARGNPLRIVDEDGTKYVVVPAGTVISRWGDKPISLRQQMTKSLLAEAVPELEVGELHPEVRACLDECQEHVDAALSGNSSDAIARAYAVQAIMKKHNLIQEDLTAEEREQMMEQMKQMQKLAEQLGQQGGEGEEGGEEGQQGDGGAPMPAMNGMPGGSGSSESMPGGPSGGGGSGGEDSPVPESLRQKLQGGGSGGSDEESGKESGNKSDSSGSGAGNEDDKKKGKGQGSGEEGDEKGEEKGKGSGSSGEGEDKKGEGGDSDSVDGKSNRGKEGQKERNIHGPGPQRNQSGQQGDNSKPQKGSTDASGGYNPGITVPKEDAKRNAEQGKGSVSDKDLKKMKEQASKQLSDDKNRQQAKDVNNRNNNRYEASDYRLDVGTAVSQKELSDRAREKALPDEEGELSVYGQALANKLKKIKTEARADKRRKRSGKLDTRAFSRGLAGDSRVYYRKGKDLDLDMEIDVNMDRSGSIIHDGQCENQYRMAKMLSKAAKATNIPLTIYGWDGGYGNVSHFAYKERHSDDLNALNSIFQTGGGGTPTEEGIRFSRRRLSNSSAKNKLMVVLTDGASNNTAETRAQVSRAREEGVEVIALGLSSGCSDEMMQEQFGTNNWRIIENFTDAPKIVGQMVEGVAKKMRSKLR